MGFKEINRKLESNGWRVIRINGSHFQYAHPDYSGKVVTVPNHGKRDISIGIVKNIEKGTGLSLRG